MANAMLYQATPAGRTAISTGPLHRDRLLEGPGAVGPAIDRDRDIAAPGPGEGQLGLTSLLTAL